MRKAYKLTDLDCANCAAKMQNDIGKLDGVNKVTVAFMTQKMVLDADPDKIDSILDQAQNICHKYEPECMIVR